MTRGGEDEFNLNLGKGKGASSFPFSYLLDFWEEKKSFEKKPEGKEAVPLIKHIPFAFGEENDGRESSRSPGIREPHDFFFPKEEEGTWRGRTNRENGGRMTTN